MANLRTLGLFFVVLILINCIQARSIDELHVREKRLFLSCGKVGKKCGGGLFSKSCCSHLVCHSTFHKCVAKGSSTSWLGDRNGK